METGPSALIEAVVAACLPASRREEILGDLHERFQSPTQYSHDALGAIVCMAVSRVTRFLMRGIQSCGRLSQQIESDSLNLCRMLYSSVTIYVSVVLWTSGAAFGVRRWWHLLVVMAPVWVCGFVMWITRQRREPPPGDAERGGTPA
jgi:hypothetical protein